MIIADLNIICINQTEPCTFLPSDEVVCEMFERKSGKSPVYPMDRFDVAHSLNGWWYTYWPNEELFFEYPFFDLNLLMGTNAIQLHPRWKVDVFELLSFYIDASPLHTIGVLIRVQDQSYNIVHKQIVLEDYTKAILNGKIHFNELYFVVK